MQQKEVEVASLRATQRLTVVAVRGAAADGVPSSPQLVSEVQQLRRQIEEKQKEVERLRLLALQDEEAAALDVGREAGTSTEPIDDAVVIAATRADEIFSSMDANDDGVVSREEFQAYLDEAAQAAPRALSIPERMALEDQRFAAMLMQKFARGRSGRNIVQQMSCARCVRGHTAHAHRGRQHS